MSLVLPFGPWSLNIYYLELSRKGLPTAGLKHLLTLVEETEAWRQKVICGGSHSPKGQSALWLLFNLLLNCVLTSFLPRVSVAIHSADKTIGFFNCLYSELEREWSTPWRDLDHVNLWAGHREDQGIICWSHMFTKVFRYRPWDSLPVRLQTQKDQAK